MPTIIKTIIDLNDNIIAPRTTASAVMLADGVTNAETKFTNLENTKASKSSEVFSTIYAYKNLGGF